MKASGPEEALRAYLETLQQPTFVLRVNQETTSIGHDAPSLEKLMIWRNAAAKRQSLDVSDYSNLSTACEHCIQTHEVCKSTVTHGWEVSPLPNDLLVARRLFSNPNVFPPPEFMVSSTMSSMENESEKGDDRRKAPLSYSKQQGGTSPLDALEQLAEHDDVAKLVFSVNWKDTPLGPLESWDFCTRNALFILLSYPWPACMCIGPEFHLVYNRPYSAILGSKHPTDMGKKAQEIWPELWDFIGPLCHQVLRTQRTVYNPDSQLFIKNSSDQNEESEMRVAWSYVPFLNSQGNTAGFFNFVVDNTKVIIDDRRSRALRSLRAAVGSTRSQSDVFSRAASALKTFVQDLPFLAIYSVEPENAQDDGSPMRPDPAGSAVHVVLKETLGVERRQDLPSECRVTLDADAASQESADWPFAKCFQQEFVCLDIQPRYRDTFENRAWPEDQLKSVALACSSQSHRLPRVLIMAGLDTRHKMDEDYRQFVLAVSRFIDTGIMAALEFESERLQLQTMERLVTLRTEELANSQARYKSFCDFSPSGVLECSKDGQITYVNEAWRRMTTISTALPLPYDCFIPSVLSTQAEDLRTQWEQAFKTRKPIQLQWQWKHGGFVFSQTFPLPSGQLMSVWTDISAHLSYSDKLVDRQRSRAEEAEAAQRMQENFISLIQHETRNPVNAILQGTDVVFSCLHNIEDIHTNIRSVSRKEHSTQKSAEEALQSMAAMSSSAASDLKEVSETVGAIAIAARHQAKIAADLLSQSKMQQGLLTLTPTDFILLAEVEKIIKLFTAQARLAQVTTGVDHDDSINELTVVRADPTRFTQILVNLISNSLRFLEYWEGERKLTIGLELHRRKPELSKPMKIEPKARPPSPDLQEHKLFLLCRVQDTGPGLTAEQQSRLFTRFNDVAHNSEANRARGGGTGLGLYLSRQLASLQGGEITAESTVGKGSTFAFYIEIEMGRRDRLEAEQDVRLLDEKPAMSPVSPQPWPPVLIVEDNSISQKLMRRQLENRGFRVKTASNGYDALEIMCSDEVLLAGLLDVEMPVKDGIQTAVELREWEVQQKRQRKLPLCAVTGNASDASIKRIKDAGMDFVLSKPYQIGDLLEYLQKSGASISSKDL